MKAFNWEILFHDFKQVRLSGALTALYANRIIQQIGSGLLGVFFPIFLYQRLGESPEKVLLYFLASYGLWFLLIPIGGKVITWLGLKKSLIISVFFGALYYFSLWQYDVSRLWWYLGVVVVAINLDRVFYLIQYHTDFAKFTNKATRGRQISFLLVISSLVSVFLPFVSGLVLEGYDFSVLLILAMILFLVSVIPLLMMPDREAYYQYGYFETYKKAFGKKYRKHFWSYAADGAQNVVGLVFWPLFIWLVLDERFVLVGVVSALIILASIILRFIVGDATDHFDKKKLLGWGTKLYAIGWIVKVFVATAFQVFLASTYHNLAQIIMRTPYDAIRYEQAEAAGSLVDEYNALREVARQFGTVLMIGVLFGLFVLTQSIWVTFVLAAGASLAISRI